MSERASSPPIALQQLRPEHSLKVLERMLDKKMKQQGDSERKDDVRDKHVNLASAR